MTAEKGGSQQPARGRGLRVRDPGAARPEGAKAG